MTDPFVVLDVEVINSPNESGYSWGRPWDLRLSVACTWSEIHGMRDWYADQVEALRDYLKSMSVVTFNGQRFDLRVLDGELERVRAGDRDIVHLDVEPPKIMEAYIGRRRHVDLFADVREASGRMLSLDSLCRGTLGHGKAGNGADAPRLWAEGKRDEVTAYCRADVELTRDLYLAGQRGTVRYSAQGKMPAGTMRLSWQAR